MGNKKWMSVALIALLLSSQSAFALQSVQGFDLSGFMGSGLTETALSSDSSESSADSTSNDDVTVSDTETRDGNYTVNGDLTVEGVLYVFGDLDVNGDLTIGKDAKVRVTGKLGVNGDVQNNGGSVYAAKRNFNGETSGKARKLDAQVLEIDPLLSAKITGEDREAAIQDMVDSKGFVRHARLAEFLDSFQDKIEERDAATYEKVKAKMLAALDRRIKQMGGITDKQLEAFSGKLESMTDEKLQKFVDKLAALQKVTKKKRFAFQLSQLKELAEDIIDARSTSVDEVEGTVPAAESTTSSGSVSVDAGSGTTASVSASGTTAETASGTTAETGSGTSSSATASGTVSP